MPDDLVVSPRLTIPGDELSLQFARSGGSGGQNVNKVSSKVELRWAPESSAAIAALPEAERAWLLGRLRAKLTNDGALIVTSTLTRDQLKNRDDAADKLVALVRAALARPKPRKPTKVPRSASRRRVADKRHKAERKRSRSGRDD